MTAKSAKKVEAPVKEVEISRVVPNAIANQTYWFGKAPYNPRAAHNMDSWERMGKHLAKGGVKGDKLAKELIVNGKHPDKTHFDFISYLERRGALTTTAPTK